MLRFLLVLTLCTWYSTVPAVNLDSLWGVWNDKSQPDTNRLKAMGKIAWDGYIFSQPDSAFHFAQMEYDLAKTLNKKSLMAHALNIQGISFNIRSDYAKALDCYSRSLKINEELGDKKSISASFSNIGNIYFEQGDHIKAIDYYTKCLQIDEELGDKSGISISLNNIGSTYGSQGDYTKAIDYFTKTLKIDEELGNKSGIAGSLLNIGITYTGQYDYAKARNYFSRSLKIFKELGNKSGITSSLINIGDTYNKQGNYSEALIFGEKAMALANEVDLVELIKEASNLLYSIYKNTGKNSEALSMYELYIEMRDSINSEENTRALIQHEYKYKYEKEKALDDAKHLKEMNLAEEKEKRQVLITYGASGSICLALLFSLFIFKRFQLTQQQKKAIKEKNEHITDSISYARTIQESSLTTREYINEKLGEHFMLYQPRDIVSGDFYWVYELENNKTMVAVADCTGHGVPGGFMSMLSISLLNEIVIENGITEVDKVLEELSSQLIKSLNQEEKGAEALDGLDATLLVLDKKTHIIEFAAAGHTFYIARNNEIIEHKGDPYPVGYFFGRTKPFTKKVIPFEKGDMLYLTSDGFIEQFGGKNDKLYGIKHFKNLILSCKDLSMEEQQEKLYRSYNNWKRGYTQIDDVCVMGIRIE